MAGIFNMDLGTVLSGVGTLAKDIRAAITGKEPIDATKAAELALKAQELELETLKSENVLLAAQAEINKVEAQSPKIFIAGWRPFIGWTCGLGIVMEFIIKPIVIWTMTILKQPPSFPALDIAQLISLVLAMLGIAGYRTYEKVKGAAGNH